MTIVKFQNEPLDDFDPHVNLWVVDERAPIISRWYDGVWVAVIRTPWIVDRIADCQSAQSGAVAFFEGDLRIVKKAAIDDLDGERVALVSSFTPPFSLDSLNDFLAGKWIYDKPLIALFQSLTRRRIRYLRHFFDVATTDTRARVCFNAFHKERRDEGEALGLVWHRTASPLEFSNGDLSRKGYLEGLRTPEVDIWLRDSFGWSEHKYWPPRSVEARRLKCGVKAIDPATGFERAVSESYPCEGGPPHLRCVLDLRG